MNKRIILIITIIIASLSVLYFSARRIVLFSLNHAARSITAVDSMNTRLLLVEPVSADETAASSTPIRTPFSIGERIEFQVKINLFNMVVGNQWMVVKECKKIRGHQTYHIHAEIHSTKGVQKMFKYELHDIVDEYVDVTTFGMIKVHTQIHEGDFKNDVHVDVYPENKAYNYRDKRKDLWKNYKGTMVGLVGMLYYSRTLPLKMKDTFTISLLNGSDIRYLNILVEAKDKISAHGVKDKGKIQCIRARQIGNENVSLWITDDSRYAPARMRTLTIKVAGLNFITITAWCTFYAAGNGAVCTQ